jgi:hypothetical protein
MIRKHQTAHAMLGLEVRRPARQSHLDGRRSPRDEVGELPLADTQQRLMYLEQLSHGLLIARGEDTYICRIDVALDYIEDGDVTRGFARSRRHHPVIRLQESAHDVQHCRTTNRPCLKRESDSYTDLPQEMGKRGRYCRW